MRFKVIALALVAFFATSVMASAQSQTGEIFGKVTDSSNGVLPGVTVTLSGPSLLQPLTAATGATGTYPFPRLEIGAYTEKFELAGFKTVIHEGIRVTVGSSQTVNASLGISTVQETITVTGESPIVDTKATGTKQTFTNELLQSIPSARDPWVILQQTAGIAMDRENIGGNMSGQQSNYVSRGGSPTNNKWSLDGVDITDMAATGSSANYFDFDAFEEMTINTGGVDVSQQTGGVGINLVTKSGSDKFRGFRPLLRDEPELRSPTTSPTRSARRARPRATRSRTSRTTASKWAGRSRRARPGSGARSASRTSASASSASSSRPRRASRLRQTRRRPATRWRTRLTTSTTV